MKNLIAILALLLLVSCDKMSDGNFPPPLQVLQESIYINRSGTNIIDSVAFSDIDPFPHGNEKSIRVVSKTEYELIVYFDEKQVPSSEWLIEHIVIKEDKDGKRYIVFKNSLEWGCDVYQKKAENHSITYELKCKTIFGDDKFHQIVYKFIRENRNIHRKKLLIDSKIGEIVRQNKYKSVSILTMP